MVSFWSFRVCGCLQADDMWKGKVLFLLYLLAFIFSVLVMITTPRTSSDLIQISRAEQRKQRLRELKTEQTAEEAEALKMTGQWALLLCFPDADYDI